MVRTLARVGLVLLLFMSFFALGTLVFGVYLYVYLPRLWSGSLPLMLALVGAAAAWKWGYLPPR